MRWCLFALLATLAVEIALAENALRVEVLRDGTFDSEPSSAANDGWYNQASGAEGVTSEWSKNGGRSDSPCIHIASHAGPDGLWIWRQHVSDPPTCRQYRLSAWAKAKDVAGNVIICIRCMGASDDLVGFATTQGTCDTNGSVDWKEITAAFVPPATTKRIEVLCFLQGTGECWFDDVSLTAGEKASPPPAPEPPGVDHPGVFHLRGVYQVEAGVATKEPVVLFPLPLTWGPQVPLSWEIKNPSKRVASWRVHERLPHDWVVEMKLTPLAVGDSFPLEWEAYVLCGPTEPVALPPGVALDGLAKAPEEAKTWLASTRCVQCGDDRFKAIAKEVRDGAKDTADLVARVQAKLAEIQQHQSGQATGLDALQALDRPGSCTSNANLAVAVYRACGVPARVLSGYPVWSGPLQTHYICEVWLPETGWYPVESTILHHPWPQSQQMAVSLVYPEDEDKSAGRSCAADGVPYLSLTESPGANGQFFLMGVIPGHDGCDHEATRVREFARDDGAWKESLELARTRWSAWLAKGKDAAVPDDVIEAARPFGACESLEALRTRLR